MTEKKNSEAGIVLCGERCCHLRIQASKIQITSVNDIALIVVYLYTGSPFPVYLHKLTSRERHAKRAPPTEPSRTSRQPHKTTRAYTSRGIQSLKYGRI